MEGDSKSIGGGGGGWGLVTNSFLILARFIDRCLHSLLSPFGNGYLPYLLRDSSDSLTPLFYFDVSNYKLSIKARGLESEKSRKCHLPCTFYMYNFINEKGHNDLL
jgi:hypothetical protein